MYRTYSMLLKIFPIHKSSVSTGFAKQIILSYVSYATTTT
jgi:hypothetical protein